MAYHCPYCDKTPIGTIGNIICFFCVIRERDGGIIQKCAGGCGLLVTYYSHIHSTTKIKCSTNCGNN